MRVEVFIPYSDLIHEDFLKRSKGNIERFREFLKVYMYQRLFKRFQRKTDEIWGCSEVEEQIEFRVVPWILRVFEEFGKVPKALSLVLHLGGEGEGLCQGRLLL